MYQPRPPITVSVFLDTRDGRRIVANFDVNSLYGAHAPNASTADYEARANDPTNTTQVNVSNDELTTESAFLLECLRAGVRDALELYHRPENREPPTPDTIVPPETGDFPVAVSA